MAVQKYGGNYFVKLKSELQNLPIICIIAKSERSIACKRMICAYTPIAIISNNRIIDVFLSHIYRIIVIDDRLLYIDYIDDTSITYRLCD